MDHSHQDSGCQECVFVSTHGNLKVFPKPEDYLKSQKPMFLGKFTMPEWVGHANFYVFLCPDCGEVNIDYPHGYVTGYGFLYFWCRDCCNRQLLISERDIYQKDGIAIPIPLLSLREKWKLARKIRKQAAKKKSVTFSLPA